MLSRWTQTAMDQNQLFASSSSWELLAGTTRTMDRALARRRISNDGLNSDSLVSFFSTEAIGESIGT